MDMKKMESEIELIGIYPNTFKRDDGTKGGSDISVYKEKDKLMLVVEKYGIKFSIYKDRKIGMLITDEVAESISDEEEIIMSEFIVGFCLKNLGSEFMEEFFEK